MPILHSLSLLPHRSPHCVESGPYTCLRAVGQRSVAMLDFHLDRLRRSAQASGLLDEVESRQGYESLQQGIPTAIANALLAFSEGVQWLRSFIMRTKLSFICLQYPHSLRSTTSANARQEKCRPSALSLVCVTMITYLLLVNTCYRLGREV